MKQLISSNVTVEITNESSRLSTVANKINCPGREDKDDAFFVVDLSDVARKHKLWHSELPRVEPHYAVKCNDDAAILHTLAELGTGFDCASKAEIQKVIEMGVSPDRIIYANPCKQNSHIKFAAKRHVAQMTFDNEMELHKVKVSYPDAKLVLRILPPADTKCQCQLGMKYGCHPKQTPQLLRTAKQLGLNVIGVSFHVGSGCYDPTAFPAAIASARAVFDIGKKEGFNFTLLDIGGGFPGQEDAELSFEEICKTLRPALDCYFPESSDVRIISEPGRFFVASALTLAVNIISKRAIPRDNSKLDNDEEVTANDEPAFMYYVNDGVYGSFNCLLYDHASVKPTLLEDHSGDQEFTSSVWGPTCDGLDCLLENIELPELFVGNWIVFHDMGAYTMCAASTFNGMPKPRCYYIADEALWAASLNKDVSNVTSTFKSALSSKRASLHEKKPSFICDNLAPCLQAVVAADI